MKQGTQPIRRIIRIGETVASGKNILLQKQGVRKSQKSEMSSVLPSSTLRYLRLNFPSKEIANFRVIRSTSEKSYYQIQINQGEFVVTFDQAGRHLWTDGPFPIKEKRIVEIDMKILKSAALKSPVTPPVIKISSNQSILRVAERFAQKRRPQRTAQLEKPVYRKVVTVPKPRLTRQPLIIEIGSDETNTLLSKVAAGSNMNFVGIAVSEELSGRKQGVATFQFFKSMTDSTRYLKSKLPSTGVVILNIGSLFGGAKFDENELARFVVGFGRKDIYLLTQNYRTNISNQKLENFKSIVGNFIPIREGKMKADEILVAGFKSAGLTVVAKG